MYKFIPKRVYFEPSALETSIGKEIYDKLYKEGITVKRTTGNRTPPIPESNLQEAYFEAKQTLILGIKKSLKSFQTCKPSAHYQLPITSSCPGKCEYCYLQTTLGKKPFLRAYINIEEILARAKEYIDERKPEITVFEGAATSDPLPTEELTGALRKSIEFFAQEEFARFRFVTKFTNIDSLLEAEHNGHTRWRFSLNSDYVINSFEHSTPRLKERLEAAGKVSKAKYPLGFIIGPIIVYEGWQDEYQKLLSNLKNELDSEVLNNLTFELITHRFTSRAKSNILEVFPNTKLPMIEEERQFKYGQFGYGKYIYPKEVMEDVRDFFIPLIKKLYPRAEINYVI